MISHPARALLDAYVDAELDLSKTLELEEHLGRCSSCSMQVDGVRALKQAAQQNELYFHVPSSTAAAVRRKLGAEKKAGKNTTAIWTTMAGAAASLALVWSLGWLDVGGAKDPLRQEAVAN